jgi:ABC-type transport system involved in multi-copper enzyme maturation permease subunit
MRALLTIVQMTLHEAARRRVLVATLIGAAAFLILFAIGFHFVSGSVRDEAGMTFVRRRMMLNTLTLAGLYATHFLGVLTAVLLPVDTLSGEISSGVLQTVASKPVPRWSIVLGKWLAYCIASACYTLFVASGVLLIARVMGDFTPPGVLQGLPLMMLEGMLFVTLSIAGGTRLSTVTNGILAFGLYGIAFLGNLVEQIGTFADNLPARNVGTVASLIMPTESMWGRAAYLMQPAIMRDLNMTPFAPASLPSDAMIVWAFVWGALMLAWGVRGFSKRAL